MVLTAENSILDVDLAEAVELRRHTATLDIRETVNHLISEAIPVPIPTGTPILELTPRYPYNPPLGSFDVLSPGRRDTDTDMVFFDPIRQTGPSPGEWDGSVLYGTFNAPVLDDYVVVANFLGTMGSQILLNGPWGTKSVQMPYSYGWYSGALASRWHGSCKLQFALTVKGNWMILLKSLQIFQMP